jgi:hypothetical protein
MDLTTTFKDMGIEPSDVLKKYHPNWDESPTLSTVGSIKFPIKTGIYSWIK